MSSAITFQSEPLFQGEDKNGGLILCPSILYKFFKRRRTSFWLVWFLGSSEIYILGKILDCSQNVWSGSRASLVTIV